MTFVNPQTFKRLINKNAKTLKTMRFNVILWEILALSGQLSAISSRLLQILDLIKKLYPKAACRLPKAQKYDTNRKYRH